MRRLTLSVFVFLSTACASTNLEQRVVGQKPADVSSFQAGLWREMDQAEERLSRSGSLVKDEELNAYIAEVTCVIAEAHCADIRPYILRDPDFNAAMAPNGMLLINTGLLLRLTNEAQLAYILGHEVGHFVEQHSFERYAKWKNGARASAFLTASVGYIFAAGATAEFSRDQELEADESGIIRAIQQGYDGREGAALWRHLHEEVAASSNRSKRKEYDRLTYMEMHPLPTDREAMLMSIANEVSDGQRHEEVYQEQTRAFLMSWLEDQIGERDVGATMQLIDRLMDQRSEMSVLEYAKGEVYRVRSEDGDRARATAAYNRAVAHEDAPPNAWRQLGDIYYGLGQYPEAKQAFGKYLQRRPDAGDRDLIETLIENIGD